MALGFCNTNKTLLLAILSFFISFLGCAEKKAELATPKKAKTTPAECDDSSSDSELRATQDELEDCSSEPDPPGDPIGLYDLCASLKSNSDMKNQHSSFLTKLCTEGKLEELRTQYYKGSGDAKISQWSAVGKTGDISEILVGSAMVTPTTPQAYFAMTRLQMTRPTEFKSKGFATNEKVTYTPNTPTESSVKYKYRFDETADRFIEYNATTNFFTFKKNEAYLISTMSDAEGQNIKTFRGIIAVVKAGTKTEVIAVSFQSISNDGKHESAVTDVRKNLADEQKRMYTNSKDATKAE